ncbi:MAG: alpha/beta hydrolase [Novosphingobium sp.]
MRRTAALILAVFAIAATPALAQEVVYETITEEVIVEAMTVEDVAVPTQGGERFVFSAPAPVPQGIASFGPFRVLDDGRAALVAATDGASPAHFAAMLRAYPAIALLEMVECPGTEDDRANLRLGRMLHARGIATHVPDGGSVRSGGVELFLAGVRHTAAPRAEFAVHAWADEDGREPKDYAADAPENRAYLDYYREMGMSTEQAAAFYAMTNSVPNAQATWLTAADMGRWVSLN